MKRFTAVIFSVILISLSFVGCSTMGNSDELTESQGVAPLESFFYYPYEVSYPLADLQAFFDECDAKRFFSNSQDRLSWEDVNEAFPVIVLRQVPRHVAYSIFPVTEGGYYYVFWSWYPTNCITDYFAYFTVYLTKDRLTEEDFSSVQIGESTAADIYEIDPMFEEFFLRNAGPVSYSLLDNGEIMRIEYTKNFEGIMPTSLSDYTVSALAVVPHGTVDGGLGYILLCDLPAVLP